MLARLYSKSFKLGFSSTWIKKFQVYKLGLQKAEKLEIKLPTFVESWWKQGNSKHIYVSISISMYTYFCFIGCADHNKLWKILKEMGIPPYLSLEKAIFRSRSNSYNQKWNNWLVQNWERSRTRLYIVTLLIWVTCRVHHEKHWAGGSISWNQDCQEKYQ